MTVSTSTNRIEYTGDAVTTAFSFPYYFLANGDLKVYLDGVLQTITTHYTVAGAGVGAGGTVTFVTAPPNGDLVVIYREVAITQSVDYTPNDPFPANTHEQALDRLTMIAQQLDEEAGRSLALPSTSTYSDLTLPDPQAGYFLQWKADLSGFQNVIQVPTSTYTVSAFGETLIDDANAAAALVTLGLTLTAAEYNEIYDMHGALIYVSAASVAAAAPLVFAGTSYDTDSIKTSTSRLTIPAGYTYAEFGFCQFCSGSPVSIELRKNGTVLKNGCGYQMDFGLTEATPVKSAIIPVVAGDYFELFADTTAGVAVFLDSWFSVRLYK